MLNRVLLDKLENVLLLVGSYLGLSQIESILGIVILSFQVVLVLYKMGYKLYEKIKNKKFDEVDDVIKEGVDELEDLSKTTKKESE